MAASVVALGALTAKGQGLLVHHAVQKQADGVAGREAHALEHTGCLGLEAGLYAGADDGIGHGRSSFVATIWP